MPHKILGALLIASAVMFLATVQAGDNKEVTLKGTITCAKCDLKLAKKCETVIKVGSDVYYFDTAAHGKNHKEICQTPKAGSVTGTVAMQGEKKVVTVKSVKFE